MSMQTFKLRPVNAKDAETLRTLALACPPLDVHTPYTYWVISRFFGHISFLLEREEIEVGQKTGVRTPVGYITALDTPETVFVWQIGILPQYRGQKFSRMLIDAVYQQSKRLGKDMCTTIDDDNECSKAAFISFCARNALRLQSVDTLELKAADLPDFYEAERIYRIGNGKDGTQQWISHPVSVVEIPAEPAEA